MGYFRILLVPVYLYVYLHASEKNDYLLAAAIIGISSLTDLLDGKIARKFHMVTEFGKILDPAADKITQAALVISFTFRYPLMKFVLFIFVIKEIFMSVAGAVMLSKGQNMNGAQWYGKVCTCVLDCVMIVLLLFPELPLRLANFCMGICVAALLFSFFCYLHLYYQMWKRFRASSK